MRILLLLLFIWLATFITVSAQNATTEEKAAAQAAFQKIDAGLLAMPWSFGYPDVKPDLERLGTLISTKGVKVVVRNIKVKSETNPTVIKDWATEKLYTFDKFQEALKFQIKYIDQQAANPEKTPAESQDPLLIELNKRLEAYWGSRGGEGDEAVEPQRKSVGEWAWIVQYSKAYKTKTPVVGRVRLVKEGGAWKLSEIYVAEIVF